VSTPLGSTSYQPPTAWNAPDDDWGRRRPGPPIWVIVAVVAIALVAVVSLVFWWYAVSSAPAGGRPYALWPYFPFGLFFVLFVAFFLVRIAFWTGYRGRRYGNGGRYRYGQRARAILAERYARGEITREQYHQMLQDLRPPP
jgi:putative membrane protein